MEDIECFRCPYCVGCNECGDFKKIMELKRVGLVIYRHTVTSALTTAGKVSEVKFRPGENTPDSEFNSIPVDAIESSSVFNNAIIMLNTGNFDIILEDFLSEFDQNSISCPRCRFIKENTKLLLKSVPVINKSDIKGVCNLCKLKQQTSRATCNICDEIVRKFTTAKNLDGRRHEAYEDERKDDVEKRIPSKGQIMKHNQEISRAYFDINKITLDESLLRSKEDPLISELEIPKSVLGLDSSAYINADQTIKIRNKVIFKESITIADKHLKPVVFETKVRKKSIMKSQSTKPSSFSPYHYGDNAASSEKEDSTKIRRYHSDESLLSSLSSINDELFIKQFKFFFPHIIKKEENKMLISSSEILKETRDRLKAEGEEKIRQQEEMCKMQEERERKKEIARLAVKVELEMKKELTQHIDKKLSDLGKESKTERSRKSKSIRGSYTSLTENESLIRKKEQTRKQSVKSFDDEKRHSTYNDKDEYERRDTKLSKSGTSKDKEKNELIDEDKGRQFGKRKIENPGREEAKRSEKEKGEKYEKETKEKDVEKGEKQEKYKDPSRRSENEKGEKLEKVKKEKDVEKGEKHEKYPKEKYKEPSRKAEGKKPEEEREKKEISSEKSKYKKESEKNAKDKIGNGDLSKSRDNKEVEYKQHKEKAGQSKAEKPKRDEIIATKPDKLSKDRSTFKDSKEETTTKIDKKTHVQDQEKEQHDEFAKLKTGKESQWPVETDQDKSKLPISKDTHKEMEKKNSPQENKIKKAPEAASSEKQKFVEPSSSKTSKPSMANLKEVPEKKQKSEGPSMSKITKKELLPNQKDAAKKGQNIDEVSQTSKETKKEQLYKQKESVENGKNIGEPKLASKGTNKEPTSILRVAPNIGQKVEELSPASKGAEKGPMSKQKEATVTGQNVEEPMLVSKGTKKVPASKLKEVSEKGQKVEEPLSVPKETKKEPLSQQKEGNKKGQKVQEPMVPLKGTKKESPKLNEAIDLGRKIENTPSVSTGTKKDMLPSPKLKEDIEKGQKKAELSDSKTTKKQLPPPPTLKGQPQKTPNKNEIDLLNKLLTHQEDEKGDDNKTRQTRDEQLKKAAEATAKLPTLPDPLKSKPIFRETKKEPTVPQTAKEQKQKSEQKGPVIDLKNIKIQASENDLISKMITTKRQPVNEEKHLKTVTQPLPEIPVKRRIVRKKPSSLSLDSSLISESLQGKKSSINEIIFGEIICKKNEVPVKRETELQPSMFKSSFTGIHTAVGGHAIEEIKLEPVIDMDNPQGVLRYALSDSKYIVNGWTVLPTEKIVRKMNIYRMRPAHPEFDWFKHNKSKGAMQYCSGERLAEFDDNGCGRWYYRNGRIALDYYDSEEINAQQRIVIYSSGEPDERRRSCPVTVLGVFDYKGNGAVFDHSGKIRLKYTQDEGVVLDRALGRLTLEVAFIE